MICQTGVLFWDTLYNVAVVAKYFVENQWYITEISTFMYRIVSRLAFLVKSLNQGRNNDLCAKLKLNRLALKPPNDLTLFIPGFFWLQV